MTSPISIYDPHRYDSLHPIFSREAARRGGQNSVKNCKRDLFGRFAPRNNTVSIPDDYRHGQAGGKARAAGKRNKKGQYTK